MKGTAIPSLSRNRTRFYAIRAERSKSAPECLRWNHRILHNFDMDVGNEKDYSADSAETFSTSEEPYPPLYLTLIAILNFIFGGTGIVMGGTSFVIVIQSILPFWRDGIEPPSGSVFLLVAISLQITRSSFLLASGIGLSRYRKWGRYCCLIFGGYVLLSIPFPLFRFIYMKAIFIHQSDIGVLQSSTQHVLMSMYCAIIVFAMFLPRLKTSLI